MHVAEFSSLVFSAKLYEIHSKEAKGVGLGGTNRVWTMSGVGYLQEESPGGTLHLLPYWGRLESSLGGCRSASAWKLGMSEVSRHGSCIDVTEVQLGIIFQWCYGHLNPFFWLQHSFWLAKVHVIWQTRARSLHIFLTLGGGGRKEKNKVLKSGTLSLRNIVSWEFLSNWRIRLIASYCVVIEGTRRMYGVWCFLIPDSVLGCCAVWGLNLTGGFF